MLYHLLYALRSEYTAFNVFRYITFRSLLAALLSLTISFVLGPWLIRRLTERQIGQVIRNDGPERHLAKAGTPTMGGTLILFSFILATLLLADLTNAYVWLVILVTLGFAVIGFIDDYRKLVRRSTEGLWGRYKLMGQFAVALAAAAFLYFKGFNTTLTFPFFKEIHPDLGFFYIPFTALVVVFISNAVNLTDGLDGLAIGPVMTTAGAFIVFAYVAGNVKNAEYLQIPYVAGAADLAIFCAAILAAGLGFLWFNAYPAMMIMGDVGALPLGAALGIVAVLTKQELALIIAGGVFVVEAFSVMVQLGSYKLRRKRVFRMAPIHHHFELLGWPEPQIIVRFWILSAICALVALSTLKLR